MARDSNIGRQLSKDLSCGFVAAFEVMATVRN